MRHIRCDSALVGWQLLIPESLLTDILLVVVRSISQYDVYLYLLNFADLYEGLGLFSFQAHPFLRDADRIVHTIQRFKFHNQNDAYDMVMTPLP